MIKHKVTILLILAIQSCFSQNLLETINAYNSSILDNTKEYKMLIISDSSCGYCQITYKELQKFTSKIQIIILDYHEDNSSEIEKFNNYKFIPAREISEIKEQDFFPILFLYDKNNKLIWSKKGWFDSNLKKIRKKTNYQDYSN
jgi:thioredoxin-related protein